MLTPRQQFLAAHKLARLYHQPGDRYQITFGAALRQVRAQDAAMDRRAAAYQRQQEALASARVKAADIDTLLCIIIAAVVIVVGYQNGLIAACITAVVGFPFVSLLSGTVGDILRNRATGANKQH